MTIVRIPVTVHRPEATPTQPIQEPQLRSHLQDPVRPTGQDTAEQASAAATAEVERATSHSIAGEPGPEPAPARAPSAPSAQRSAAPDPASQAALQAEEEPADRLLAEDLQAEMAAFRRRTEARLAQQAEDEKRRLLRAFLQVADNLERALGYGARLEGEASGNCPAGSALRQGVELTYRGLQQMLAHEGVEAMDAVGQTFDPRIHEAMLTTPAQASPGTVTGELERGYLYRGELLRPARVQVAR